MSMKDLASRAVASPHWRWMQGMTSVWGDDDGQPMRWLCRSSSYGHVMCGPCADGHPRHNDGVLPDLTDPATLGCLLALVREAVEPMRAPGDWPMVCPYQSQARKWGVGAWLNESGKATFAALVLPTYETEAAALVAALEAAA